MFLNSGDVLCHLDEVLMLAGKVHYKNNVLLFGSEFAWPDGMVKAFYPSFSFCTMPTSHQAMLFNTEIARAIMYNTKYMFSADYDLYLQMSNRERQPWVSDIVIVKTAPVGFTETSLTAYLIECFKINHFHFNIWCAGIRLIVELSKVVLRILLRTFFKKRWILQIRRLRGGVYVNDN